LQRTPLLLLSSVLAFAADEPAGQRLFQTNCAVCHDHVEPGARIPPTSTLRKLPVDAIQRALESGVMRSQGAVLTALEKNDVSRYLSLAVSLQAPAEITNRCMDNSAWPGRDEHADWPQWGGGGSANWRFQTAEAAGLRAEDVPKLKLRWAFALPETTSVRSQPAVYRGRIFMGSQDGTVYSLDAATGCTHWAMKLAGQVRSGPSIGMVAGRPLAVTGDVTGSVYGLDATTGRLLWKRKLDQHPATIVTSPAVFDGGRIYIGAASYEEVLPKKADYLCCTFRGSVSALNAADGSLVWKTYTIPETPTLRENNKRGAGVMGPSGAAVWAAPTVDAAQGALYVTTGDNYSDPPTRMSDSVLALALADGRILWSKQFTTGDAYNTSCSAGLNCPDAAGPDFDFGASAMLVDLPGGERALLLGQKSGMVHAVDPDRQGELLWQTRIGKGGPLGGIQWGPATDGTQIYAALSDIGFRVSPDSGKPEPDPTKGGGLFALRIGDGKLAWGTPNPGCGERRPCSPAQSAAVTAIQGVVFSGAMDGHLRAYETRTGKIVWDYDAMHDYQTVNGEKGTGGAFDTGGPVVAGGMVFAGSGYAQWGGLAGNVLLAFGVEAATAGTSAVPH
jgi:polyvinyl alcohol dehydrogenase (cytochrome)